MFEGLIDAVVVVWTSLVVLGQEFISELISQITAIRTEIANFNPTQRLVLWIQFGVGVLTIHLDHISVRLASSPERSTARAPP